MTKYPHVPPEALRRRKPERNPKLEIRVGDMRDILLLPTRKWLRRLAAEGGGVATGWKSEARRLCHSGKSGCGVSPQCPGHRPGTTGNVPPPRTQPPTPITYSKKSHRPRSTHPTPHRTLPHANPATSRPTSHWDRTTISGDEYGRRFVRTSSFGFLSDLGVSSFVILRGRRVPSGPGAPRKRSRRGAVAQRGMKGGSCISLVHLFPFPSDNSASSSAAGGGRRG